MIFFLVLVTTIIFFSIFYLLDFSKNKKNFIFFFTFIFLASFTIYNFTGNKNSFSYNIKLEKQIEELIRDPNNFANIQPKKIIFFLENKLSTNPKDFEGWMLLARTCFISGHFQKADLYYNKALKYFPNNETILYELAMLRKNTNQFLSALTLLDKIYEINPRNLDSIELNFEILKIIKNRKLIEAKIKRLKKEKFLKEIEVNSILKKLNL